MVFLISNDFKFKLIKFCKQNVEIGRMDLQKKTNLI